MDPMPAGNGLRQADAPALRGWIWGGRDVGTIADTADLGLRHGGGLGAGTGLGAGVGVFGGWLGGGHAI
jgi:hypothetical protein